MVPDVRQDSDFVTLAIDEGARDLVALVQNPALTIAQALSKSFALRCGAIWLFVHMFSPFVPGSIGRTTERIIAAVVDLAVGLDCVAVFRVFEFGLFDLRSNPFPIADPGVMVLNLQAPVVRRIFRIFAPHAAMIFA